MSQTQPISDIQPATSDAPVIHTGAPGNELVLPLIGWGCYVMGFGLIGLLIAYIDRGNAQPPVDGNYRYMIRTFWISCVYALVVCLAWAATVGLLAAGAPALSIAGVLIAWLAPAILVVWFYIRCIKGIVMLVREQPIEDPATWLV